MARIVNIWQPDQISVNNSSASYFSKNIWYSPQDSKTNNRISFISCLRGVAIKWTNRQIIGEFWTNQAIFWSFLSQISKYLQNFAKLYISIFRLANMRISAFICWLRTLTRIRSCLVECTHRTMSVPHNALLGSPKYLTLLIFFLGGGD